MTSGAAAALLQNDTAMISVANRVIAVGYITFVAVWRTKAGRSTRRASQFGGASTHHSPLECAQRILSARIAASPSASLTPVSFAYSLTVTGRSRTGIQRWSVTIRLKRLSHHCFAFARWAPGVLGGQLNETERESASGKLSAHVALPCGAARCDGLPFSITCRSAFALGLPFSELALGNY